MTTQTNRAGGLDAARQMIAKVKWFRVSALNLGNLGLSSETLQRLLPEFCHLPLRWLALHNNALTELPSQMWELTQLQNLNLSTNQVSVLSPQVGRLSRLRVLNLRDNQLRALPGELDRLEELQSIEARGNPLLVQPMWSAGTRRVSDMQTGEQAAGKGQHQRGTEKGLA